MAGSKEDSQVIEKGRVQEHAPPPVAVVDEEDRYHRMR